MARHVFWPTRDSYVLDYDGHPCASNPVRVYAAQVGGSPLTDLQYVDAAGSSTGAVPSGVLVSDANGLIPPFAGPDGLTVVWGDHGYGATRVAIDATDGGGSGGGTVPVGTTTGTVAAGDDSRIVGAVQKSANLSDVGNATTARNNLGAEMGLTATAVKTTNYTAAAGDLVPVDTTGGAVTITLPTAPANLTRIGIKHVVQGGTNTVTVALGGSDVFNVSGGATTGTLTLLNQSLIIQYKATGAIWTVTSSDMPLSQLDVRFLLTTSKAAASGVASLDSGTKVPTAQLGTGTADSTKVLAGDRTWAPAVPLALAGQTPAQEPVALGAAGVGTGGAGARMDHVHPTTGLALTTDLVGLVTTRRKSGFYYATSATGTANIAILGNQLYAAPWLVPHTLSVDRLACHVDTVGSAGALIRLGIYADDGFGWPGALVLDAGTMVGDSGTSLRTITVSQSLTRGLYHLAIALQGSPATLPKFRGTTSGNNFLLMGGIDLATLGMWTGTASACTGAFPSTAEQPGGSATGNFNSVVLGARIV